MSILICGLANFRIPKSQERDFDLLHLTSTLRYRRSHHQDRATGFTAPNCCRTINVLLAPPFFPFQTPPLSTLLSRQTTRSVAHNISSVTLLSLQISHHFPARLTTVQKKMNESTIPFLTSPILYIDGLVQSVTDQELLEVLHECLKLRFNLNRDNSLPGSHLFFLSTPFSQVDESSAVNSTSTSEWYDRVLFCPSRRKSLRNLFFPNLAFPLLYSPPLAFSLHTRSHSTRSTSTPQIPPSSLHLRNHL